MKDQTKEKNPLAWEEVSCEHVICDEWMDLRRKAYRFPDGKIFSPFYNYSRRDYSVIVATDTEGRFICVKQFRHGIEEVTTEFPAGGIERSGRSEYRKGHGGDVADSESALAAARRELLEETGYASDEWSPLIVIPSNASIADNYAYLFRAKNCEKIGSQKLDETEFLNIVTYSEKELEALILSGGFQQAVHVMGYYLAKDRAG